MDSTHRDGYELVTLFFGKYQLVVDLASGVDFLVGSEE